MPLNARRQSGTRLKIILAVIAVFALLWGGGLFVFASTMPVEVDRPDAQTDAIVVLTGGSGRLRTGLDLLLEDRAEQLFVSGVYRGVEVGQLLAVAKQSPGEIENRISLGNADDTIENAMETEVWMRQQGFTSLRLVTAAYHMPRSLLEFHAAMPDIDIVAHPVFPAHVKQDEWWAWPGTSALTITEFNKFLLAWVRQKTRGLIGGVTGNETPT